MKKIKFLLIPIIFVLISSCATQYKMVKCPDKKPKVPFTVWIVFIGQVK